MLTCLMLDITLVQMVAPLVRIVIGMLGVVGGTLTLTLRSAGS